MPSCRLCPPRATADMSFRARSQATKNEAGLWVVGKSKSNSRGTRTAARPETIHTLRRFYAPWQRDLRTLLSSHNLSLLPDLPIPQ
jgi:hypothetical protein